VAEIFLSYRRDDTGIICERVALRLAAKFGPKSVFRDASAIYVGSDWEHTLRAAMEDCYVVVALIGPEWAGTQGRSRIHEPGDYVRLELATALAKQKRVLPVLVNGARMPLRQELPPDLASLADIPPLFLRPDPAFDTDMQRVIAVCKPAARRRIPHPAVAFWGVLGVLGYLTTLGGVVAGASAISLFTYVIELTFLCALISGFALCVSSVQSRTWIWFAAGAVVTAPLLVLGVGATVQVQVDDRVLTSVSLAIQEIDGLLTPVLAIMFGFFGPRRLSSHAPGSQRIPYTRGFAAACALLAGTLLGLSVAILTLPALDGYLTGVQWYIIFCAVITVVGTASVAVGSLLSARWRWFLALTACCLFAILSIVAFIVVPDTLSVQSFAVFCAAIVVSVITLVLFAIFADRRIRQSQKEINAHATDLPA
jgi:hypothetical protein